MSDDRQQDEIDAMASSTLLVAQNYRKFKAEVVQLTHQRDQFERESAILRSENENYQKTLARVAAERDWYMREIASLKAKLTTCGSIFLQAVQDANMEAYRPNGHVPAIEDPHDGDDVPHFLTAPQYTS